MRLHCLVLPATTAPSPGLQSRLAGCCPWVAWQSPAAHQESRPQGSGAAHGGGSGGSTRLPQHHYRAPLQAAAAAAQRLGYLLHWRGQLGAASHVAVQVVAAAAAAVARLWWGESLLACRCCLGWRRRAASSQGCRRRPSCLLPYLVARQAGPLGSSIAGACRRLVCCQRLQTWRRRARVATCRPEDRCAWQPPGGRRCPRRRRRCCCAHVVCRRA